MTTKAPNPILEAFEPAACFRTIRSVKQTDRGMRFEGFAFLCM